ncbi:hypothetical protein B0J14DRAFT_66508 [Halenospora varia]|nr:hypothetical protein B0J14DRAFT_66508 [Halenospora varia]
MASCSYDCSAIPTSNDPYPDISGIGVVISFMATAYFAVVILVGHYVLAYEPLDPFRREKQEPESCFRPNPVDQLVLSSRLIRFCRHADGRHRRPGLQATFNKLVLNMSDLQIVSGLAILISGFGSVVCGLSIYHWDTLVYLTWFSSITHMTALTFLRNYLYSRPAEQLWRLVSMSTFLCMLIAAILPMVNFGSISERPRIYQQSAVCFFGVFAKSNKLSYNSVIISILILVWSFAVRVVQLHKTLSVGTFRRARAYLSTRYRSFLLKVYLWSGVAQTGAYHWKRTRVYNPCLAIFMIFSLWLDLYLSMLSEIYWLLVSIAWGTAHLFITRSSNPEMIAVESDWTFGQILPVVLLAGPLVSIIEYAYPHHQEPTKLEISSSSNDSLIISQPALQLSLLSSPLPSSHHANPQLALINTPLPDLNYRTLPWYTSFLLLTVLSILSWTTLTLLPLLTKTYLHSLGYLLIMQPFAMFLYALLSLNFSSSAKRGERKWLDSVAQVGLWLLCGGIGNGFVFLESSLGSAGVNGVVLGGTVGVYALGCAGLSWWFGER